MSTLLLVEDDDRIRAALALALGDEGYVVTGVPTAELALAAFRREVADVVVVDLMLPGMDGLECIHALRQDSDVPVMVVSARSDTHDVVAALEAGADDYVVKPVEVKELAARLRALRRRVRPGPADRGEVLLGDVHVRPQAGEVLLGGRPVSLTRTEFRLICELAAQPDTVLSRAHLLRAVWDYEFGDPRVVDVHVGRLRRKIEADPSDPRIVLTVRGLGYKAVDTGRRP